MASRPILKGIWKKSESMGERFMNRVKKTDSCWIWTGVHNAYGYGVFSYRMKKYMAHRASYELFIGKIKDGLYACHICDNPGCVNPNHLFIGTQKDNMKDASKKHRVAHGETSGTSKLIESQVKDIKLLCKTNKLFHREIALRYNVSRSLVGMIAAGNRWNHIS